MEAKTSKVKRIENVKPHTNNYGTTYYHLLEMENGDKINIGKKKELKVGWEVTYEITETGQQEYNTAKSAMTQNNTPKPQKRNQQATTSSFALSYAKDMMCKFIETEKVTDKDADKIADKAILIAGKFNNWLKENS